MKHVTNTIITATIIVATAIVLSSALAAYTYVVLTTPAEYVVTVYKLG